MNKGTIRLEVALSSVFFSLNAFVWLHLVASPFGHQFSHSNQSRYCFLWCGHARKAVIKWLFATCTETNVYLATHPSLQASCFQFFGSDTCARLLRPLVSPFVHPTQACARKLSFQTCATYVSIVQQDCRLSPSTKCVLGSIPDPGSYVV